MKKSVLLIVLGLGLAFISCEKQDVQPRTNANINDVPAWEKASVTTAPPTSTGTTDATVAGDDSGGITDPNDDEDGNGRKKV